MAEVRFWRLSALLATGVTLWLALMPVGDGPELLPWDKAGHFLSFYVLMVLYSVAWPRASRWWLIGGLVLAGGAIEIVQGLIGRDADLMDWVADILGIGFAAISARLERLRLMMRE